MRVQIFSLGLAFLLTVQAWGMANNDGLEFIFQDMRILDAAKSWKYNDTEINNITAHPYKSEDWQYIVKSGLEYYQKIYDNKTYFVDANSDKDSDPLYVLLSNNDSKLKRQFLEDEANFVKTNYLDNDKASNFFAHIIKLDAQPIGALLYQTAGDSALMILELVALVDLSKDLRKYILSDFLRKLAPHHTTHKYFVRHANDIELKFFVVDLGYKVQDLKTMLKEGIDVVQYVGLTKTYA